MTHIEILQRLQGAMTQTQFAELLGVTQSFVSQIYRGVRRPGMKVLRGVAFWWPSEADGLLKAMREGER